MSCFRSFRTGNLPCLWTNAPFVEGLVADLNAALVQQFLDISVAEREAAIQPGRALNDRHRDTVEVRFRVSHGRSASSDPVTNLGQGSQRFLQFARLTQQRNSLQETTLLFSSFDTRLSPTYAEIITAT